MSNMKVMLASEIRPGMMFIMKSNTKYTRIYFVISAYSVAKKMPNTGTLTSITCLRLHDGNCDTRLTGFFTEEWASDRPWIHIYACDKIIE